MKYSQGFKARMVQRMTGREIVSAGYQTSAVPEIGRVSLDVGQVMRFDYR